MRVSGYGGSRCGAGVVMMAIGLSACGLAACSSTPSPPPPATASASPARSSSFTDRMKGLFGGNPNATVQASTGPSAADYDCPRVDVRHGAATLVIAANQGDTNAGAVRYQATLGQNARECAFLGATMTIKVGVQGRVILGPAGTPGHLDVPLRLALVHEGPEPKTIWTKLYRVPVDVPPGQSNVPFIHIEEDMTVPQAKPAEVEAYIIYVGFDQQALEQRPAPRKQQKKTPSKSG